MVYRVQVSMTINWVAEPCVVKHDNSLFRNLCVDSVKGLRKGEEVYCFTQEQVDEIKRRANFGVDVINEDDYYRLSKRAS